MYFFQLKKSSFPGSYSFGRVCLGRLVVGFEKMGASMVESGKFKKIVSLLFILHTHVYAW